MNTSKVRLVINPTPGPDTVIEIDGVRVENQVSRVWLQASVDGFPSLGVTFNCIEVEVDGELQVVHHCGLSDEA